MRERVLHLHGNFEFDNTPDLGDDWREDRRPQGATIKLGLNRTTLIYRLKKLGIYQPLWRTAAPDDFITPGQPGSPVAL